jgi:uncharacterized protein (UPF0216 family)
MLYSSKYPEGFTRNMDKALEARINNIKSTDFILPQTSKEEILNHAEEKDIERDGKTYKIKIADISDIPDFYAFVHTTEAGFTSGGTRESNFANFDAFNTLNDDRVICASYISANQKGAVERFHHEFIFNVKNSNQHVAVDHDMASHARNINQLLIEYFQDNHKDEAYRDRYRERENISRQLKLQLFGDKTYFNSKETDSEYIKRVDNIKKHLGNKPMSLKELKKIDPEFAEAYMKMFSKEYGRIFSDRGQNEALVTNPEITGIITDDFDNLPAEYLEKAQRENLPIVVIKKKTEE